MQNSEAYNMKTSLEPIKQQEELIVEYLDEDQLVQNYKDIYIVSCDEETGENYIIDYYKKYKYIIKKKQLTSTPVAANKQQLQTKDATDSDEQQQQLKSFQQEQRFIYGYVDQTELNLIDLSKVTVNKNDLLDEYFIVDPTKPNYFWVILPESWNENENLPYVSEEDLDIMNWMVHLEQNTNRKFVLDERDGTRYFIIPTDYMRDFRESLYKYYKSYKVNAEEVEPVVNKRNEMIIEYVDEDELKTVDLLNVKIQKDESYNEYYIQDPTNINHRWIVLQSNWSQVSVGPNVKHYYVYEDEVNSKSTAIYRDAQRRRFIVNKKTNIKYYLVPRVTDNRNSFKSKWLNIDHSLRKKSYKENKKLTTSKVVQTSSIKKPVEIIELPSSPKSSKKQETNNGSRLRSSSYDRSKEQQKLKPRVNNNNNSQIRYVEAIVNSQKREESSKVKQRSNSSNNGLDDHEIAAPRTYSGRTKKTVYFSENVKVSDGDNNTTPVLAQLDVPLRFDKNFSSNRQESIPNKWANQVAQPPPVKPREMKPVNARMDFTNIDSEPNATSIETINNNPNYRSLLQQQPFSYTNNSNNNKTQQQQGQIIRIKQPGRPGHLIHTNKTS